MFNRRDDFSYYFYYDTTSPTCLRWNTDIRAGKEYSIVKFNQGDVAGNRGAGKQYFSVQLQGITYTCHRIVYELYYGNSSELFIDHLNQNKSDNRIENLRAVSREINNRNHPKRKDCSSGVVGVSLYTKKLKNGELYYLWRGRVSLLNGDRYSKDFSISKYGYNEAFELAKAWRTAQITELNLLGAGYQEIHGKNFASDDCTPLYNNGFNFIE